MSKARGGPVRRYVALVVLLLLLPVLGYFYFVRGIRAGKPPARLESRWVTEEAWLAEEIARDIGEMALLTVVGDAARASAVDVRVSTAASGGPVVRIALPGKSPVDRRLESWAWAPEEYALLARPLLGEGPRRPPSSPASAQDALLAMLLSARTPQLQEQNELISTGLASEMTDWRRHEDAALLLGAFALREASEMFFDVRQVLGRMTAHLAMASALRDAAPPSVNGAVADALLKVLANRGRDAERAIVALERMAGDAHPALLGWTRVLRLRQSQDWRRLDRGEGEFLERIERFRALVSVFGAADALRMEGWAADPSPTWAQIALVDPDVETGNRLCRKALDDTIRQADAVWSLVHGRSLAEGERVAALNEPAQRFLSKDGPRVIAWGTWAALFQRHVCFLVARADRHYRRALALPDAAEQFADEADTRFGGLRLYPLFAALRALSAEHRIKPLDPAIRLAIQHPEWVPAPVWWDLSEATHDEVTRYGMPDWFAWFSTGCPRGTAYDIAYRAPGLAHAGAGGRRLRELLEASPGDYDVAKLTLDSEPGKNVDVSAAAGEFGDRMHYDLRALDRVARLAYEHDLVAYRSLRREMCELRPADCFTLAHLLVDSGEEEAAVPIYEQAVSQTPDRVVVSTNCRWLVGHYIRSGRRERAKELAEMAGEVGSADGLLTLASYLEKTGDTVGAERTIRAARDRYPAADLDQELLGLYYRAGVLRKASDYGARFKEESGRVFPDGLERVDLRALTGQPTAGLMLTQTSPQLLRAGLRGGEIIVAIDGWKVRSTKQYYVARSFDDSPDVRWIVWQHPRFIEVKLRSVNRRFDCQFREYPSPP